MSAPNRPFWFIPPFRMQPHAGRIVDEFDPCGFESCLNGSQARIWPRQTLDLVNREITDACPMRELVNRPAKKAAGGSHLSG